MENNPLVYLFTYTTVYHMYTTMCKKLLNVLLLLTENKNVLGMFCNMYLKSVNKPTFDSN